MGRFRNTLDVLSQIAFIIACVVLSGFVVVTLTRGGGTSPQYEARADLPYRAGELVPALDGISYSSARVTVLLVVRSTCTFCTQSMGFYRRIAATRHASRVQLVAVGREPAPTLEAYLKSHDLAVDRFGLLPREGFKVTATPSLIVVDQSGQVLKSWQGQLSADQATAFFDTLASRGMASWYPARALAAPSW